MPPRKRTLAPGGDDPKPPRNQAPASPEASASASEAAEPTEKAKRVSITLDANGRPDLESMRDGTTAHLRAWLSDPSLAAQLGIGAAPAGGDPGAVAGLIALPVLSLLSQAQALLFVRTIKGATPEQALIAARYSPDEQAALLPLIQKVINKYTAGWVGKYQDELALAGTVVLMGVSKASQLKAMIPIDPALTNGAETRVDEVPPRKVDIQ